MIRFLPVVVIGSRSLAYQGAADAASQAPEGLPLRPLAFLPPLPSNDLVESPFRLGRVAWRYTPRIRRCVGRSRLSACVQVLSPPFSPILLGFTLHGRCIHVLHFEPIGRAAGAVGGILALRHNAFEPHLAGVGEDGQAISFDMSVGHDARGRLRCRSAPGRGRDARYWAPPARIRTCSFPAYGSYLES